ncbi:MAG TPA: CcoQ/FixQ family Cbb3-type cytochrome c oxidase assembly chaperone [Ramlibacter sp.]|nr:CcoQ/FixQ family Cbb3-type cytochrome c oxidase assembly chaperone [Ramlibacter sp.]HET8747204.1 CcoQ/FixQ family Cbb3-type cytochrome c oxidase assembly chaperone [Ramlibacter sp.]
MDIDFLREAVTVSAFAAFLGIVWWAYTPSRKARWQEKGRLGDDA